MPSSNLFAQGSIFGDQYVNNQAGSEYLIPSDVLKVDDIEVKVINTTGKAKQIGVIAIWSHLPTVQHPDGHQIPQEHTLGSFAIGKGHGPWEGKGYLTAESAADMDEITCTIKTVRYHDGTGDDKTNYTVLQSKEFKFTRGGGGTSVDDNDLVVIWL